MTNKTNCINVMIYFFLFYGVFDCHYIFEIKNLNQVLYPNVSMIF